MKNNLLVVNPKIGEYRNRSGDCYNAQEELKTEEGLDGAVSNIYLSPPLL